jgi:hypothetical protein
MFHLLIEVILHLWKQSLTCRVSFIFRVELGLYSPQNQFKRDYLTPYRQEHPTNKQLTIFFTHDAKNDKVYFIWINDKSCFHDTRKNHGEDPCIVEFKKLQNLGPLEDYDIEIHEGKLEFSPRATDPHFMRFSALQISSHGNILSDDETYYCMSVVTEDEKAEEVHPLFVEHFKLFLSKLSAHFKAQEQNFEFRIPHFEDETIKRLTEAHDRSQWIIGSDEDLFFLKLL